MPTRRDRDGFKAHWDYVEESGLSVPMRQICRRHAVTMFDVYSDARGPTAHAARLECWWWMRARAAKSDGEVGRIYDRHGTSIAFAMRTLVEESEAQRVLLSEDTVEHLARAVAARSQARRSEAGKKRAAVNNNKKTVPTRVGTEEEKR